MGAALFACKVLRLLAKLTTNREEIEDLEQNANFFEKLAIDLLTKCYSANSEIAQIILIRGIPSLNGRTCMELAHSAGAIQFLSHICSVRLIDRIWNGHILPGPSLIRILLTTVFPPLLFSLKFRSKAEIQSLMSCPQLAVSFISFQISLIYTENK